MLQVCVLALRNKTSTKLQKSQARHKRSYDCRVRDTSVFHTCEYVLLHKPPLLNASDLQAETLAREPYNKPQCRTTGLFRIVSIQENTNTINKKGLPNTVTIYCETHLPVVAEQPLRVTTSVQPELDSSENSIPSLAPDNDTESDKYVAERIFEKIGNADAWRYVVSWYDYGPKDDTV